MISNWLNVNVENIVVKILIVSVIVKLCMGFEFSWNRIMVVINVVMLVFRMVLRVCL